MENVTELVQTIQPTYYIKGNQVNYPRLEESVTAIFQHVNDQKQFYQVVLNEPQLMVSANQIQQEIKQRFLNELVTVSLETTLLSVPIELLVEFMSSALLGLIRWWVTSEQVYTTSHMSQKLAEIITKGPLVAGGLQIIK